MANNKDSRRRGEPFTDLQIDQLRNNPNVQSVSGRTITYKPSFKLAAVKAYQQGKTPLEIFVEAGFDPATIHRRAPLECLKCWRHLYAQYGEDGLLEDPEAVEAQADLPRKI